MCKDRETQPKKGEKLAREREIQIDRERERERDRGLFYLNTQIR